MSEGSKDDKFLWASYLLRTIVFEYRVVDYQYFMREMGIVDAWKCIENIPFLDRTQRELARYSISAIYNNHPFRKNAIKIEDIMELPWDESKMTLEEAKVRGIEIKTQLDDSQMERVKMLEDMIKNGKVEEVTTIS